MGAKQAYELWSQAGKPNERDLEFWLQAEKDHDDPMCVLALNHCPYQETIPLSGGRHIAVCRKKHGDCSYRAKNFDYRKDHNERK